MNIGCDIDGTCLDFSNKFTVWMAQKHKQYILNKDIEKYFPMYKVYEQNNTEECYDLKLYAGCKDVLNLAMSKGDKVLFITKRGQVSSLEKEAQVIALTQKWQKENFPSAQGVIFTGIKEQYAKDKKIDVMIEDDAGNANLVAPYCPVILISRSWNRHLTLHPNVIVAENWFEVDIILSNFDKYVNSL